MALLSQDDLDFKGDCVCELVGGVQWYGNVTGSCMEDKETKLWSIKYDNDDKEEVTLEQLIMKKKRYQRHKQYDTEANKKLPATTIPTLPASKKKKESTVAKKKPSTKKKKTPAKPPKTKKPLKPKKPRELTEKQKKALAECLPPPKLLDTDAMVIP